jgi:uncharacterized membrane protein YfcA
VVVLGFALALVIGLALGLLGGGGSILTVPVIHYVFGVPAHDAIAMSLVVVGMTSTAALVPHARAGRVDWRLALTFGGASMVSAYVGGRVGALLPGDILIAAFAVLMLVAGMAMLLRSRGIGFVCVRRPGAGRVVAIGLGVGLITGTLGAGGGFVIVPALTLFGGLAMREAVATSLFVIAGNSLAGLAGTLQHASFDSKLALAVTGFAIGGSVVGAGVGKHISVRMLQRSFGWFVIAVGILVLARELW